MRKNGVRYPVEGEHLEGCDICIIPPNVVELQLSAAEQRIITIRCIRSDGSCYTRLLSVNHNEKIQLL